ncbi:MAG TPA: DEAD/DEAH box helicase [Solirubrobacteraceae bacterium]|jgi:ATP-dependent RNA helicase DeaD
MTTFADLGLSEPVLQALRDVGYESPSPIQEQAIPELLQGKDVIGQAQTGTGKTAAFGLPMIEYADPDDEDVQALVLTPTRELCIQVTQAIRTYGKVKGVDVVAVFGGAPIRSQQAQLKQGGQIVVGTVGRVLDLISRHSLMLQSCRYLVLDEADEMLDLGFLEDVEKILGLTPGGRQTALFSATMPPEIRALADRHLYDPVTVKVKAATLTIDTVEQFYVETKSADKVATLARVLESERPDQAIVFARTKIRTEQLYKTLRDKGMNVKALHGDMSQGSRDGVMLSFKGGRVPILVATDVAARGLDISTVTHVVNFDVPTSPDVYVHRIGRTGRVGRSGRAITFVEPKQQRELEAIEQHANTKIAPWAEGAKVAPAKVEEPPRARRHHRKPHDAAARVNGEGYKKLITSGGRAAGLSEADVVHAITAAGLDGEEIRNVRLLERFALVEVPADQVLRITETVDGTDIRGHTLRVQATNN